MFQTLSDAKAKDLMSWDVLSLTQEKTVADAVSLMDKNNRGSVVVLGKTGEMTGIFTERDLMRRVIAKGLDPKKTPLSEVMTKKVFQAQANDPAIKLLDLMCSENFRHLPILDGKKLVGIISLKQFYNYFLVNQRSMGV